MSILFKGTDGSVAIMTLAEGADKTDAIQKFRDSQDDGKYPEYYEIDEVFPLSREFRDAWTLRGGKVIIDEAKAHQIHMKRIRHVRDEKLEKLDKEHLRHLSNSSELERIEAQKQVLRDLPANWNTLEWPNELLGNRS